MGTLLLHDSGTRPYWSRLGELIESEGLMTRTSFNEKYAEWRTRRDESGDWREVTLAARLTEVIPALSGQQRRVGMLVDGYMRDFETRTEPCQGVQAMLEAWTIAVPLAVVSNFFVAGFPRRLLNRHGLDRYFEFVLDSAEFGYRKPSPKLFGEALRLASIPPGGVTEVVFVGDDWAADIEGPNQLGMQSVLYSKCESPHRNVAVIRNWREFRPW
jgi:putative hydrolase of the HAD superfamily